MRFSRYFFYSSMRLSRYSYCYVVLDFFRCIFELRRSILLEASFSFYSNFYVSKSRAIALFLSYSRALWHLICSCVGRCVSSTQLLVSLVFFPPLSDPFINFSLNSFSSNLNLKRDLPDFSVTFFVLLLAFTSLTHLSISFSYSSGFIAVTGSPSEAFCFLLLSSLKSSSDLLSLFSTVVLSCYAPFFSPMVVVFVGSYSFWAGAFLFVPSGVAD